jgi:hypothetical protein
MSLRLKFNLSLLAVMLLGLSVSGYFLHDLLQKNAREEVLHEAGLMMESALAIRAYTVDHVRPRLSKLPDDEFMPQTVPAFAATETLATLQKKYPEYGYKEATLNPTNPRDKAEPWEARSSRASAPMATSGSRTACGRRTSAQVSTSRARSRSPTPPASPVTASRPRRRRR